MEANFKVVDLNALVETVMNTDPEGYDYVCYKDSKGSLWTLDSFTYMVNETGRTTMYCTLAQAE